MSNSAKTYPSVYIDEQLPHKAALEGALYDEGFTIVKALNGADVRVLYAHNEVRPSQMNALRMFNEEYNGGKPQKAVFLSWFSWEGHPGLFSPYFRPGAGAVGNQALCCHLQLPCSILELSIAIQNLYSSQP